MSKPLMAEIREWQAAVIQAVTEAPPVEDWRDQGGSQTQVTTTGW